MGGSAVVKMDVLKVCYLVKFSLVGTDWPSRMQKALDISEFERLKKMIMEYPFASSSKHEKWDLIALIKFSALPEIACKQYTWASIGLANHAVATDTRGLLEI